VIGIFVVGEEDGLHDVEFGGFVGRGAELVEFFPVVADGDDDFENAAGGSGVEAGVLCEDVAEEGGAAAWHAADEVDGFIHEGSEWVRMAGILPPVSSCRSGEAEWRCK
jgi:hypothetical protein